MLKFQNVFKIKKAKADTLFNLTTTCLIMENFVSGVATKFFFQAKINNKTYVLKQISVKKNKNKFKKLYINYIKVIQYIKKIKIKV